MTKVLLELDVHETSHHEAQTVVRHLLEALNLVQTSPWGVSLELKTVSVESNP